jgi:leucyl/phenylalanyl-tRNA--protein transferase
MLAVPWWSPDPRGIIPVDRVHASRSLRARLRSCRWTSTLNRAFSEVMDRCRRGDSNSWISPRMIRAYGRLHALGWAHSLEIWDEAGQLIGGIYGVQIGGVFTGESMFYDRTDASKTALVDLVSRLREAGGVVIDTQFMSEHLRTLGATEISRRDFLALLEEVAEDDVPLVLDALPVSRLSDSTEKAVGPRELDASSVWTSIR